MIERTIRIGRLALQNGESLDAVDQRVTIYGDPVRALEVVLVTHALTGDSRVARWWDRVIGTGRVFDPRHRCIIGINALGSCYGSTGPSGPGFPVITVGDMVHAQARALETLGIRSIGTVIGGSLGGMQALQWALAYPKRVRRAVVIGACDRFSAQGIALNAVAREAIELHPERGLALARKIAMISYKSPALLEQRHANRPDRAGGDPRVEPAARFDVEGYLDVQGAHFCKRMNAQAYRTLTRAMDLFDVRAYPISGTIPELRFIGISSDQLFAPHCVQQSAARLRRLGFDATYHEWRSEHGHDAFLSDTGALGEILRRVAGVRDGFIQRAEEG